MPKSVCPKTSLYKFFVPKYSHKNKEKQAQRKVVVVFDGG